MAEREQSSKRDMEPKPQRDMTGTIGERHRGPPNPQQNRQQGVKPGESVGRDVPDESKEHLTEIAVEAGRKGRERRDDKH